jgi:hypothetical protein
VSLATVDAQLESLDTLDGVDTLMLFVAEDERPLQGMAGYTDWRLCGHLSRLLLARFFTGAKEDAVLLPADRRVKADRIMVAGLGPRSELGASSVGEALQRAARMLNKAGTKGVALEIPGLGQLDDETRARLLTKVFLPELKANRVVVLAEKPLGRLLSAG